MRRDWEWEPEQNYKEREEEGERWRGKSRENKMEILERSLETTKKEQKCEHYWTEPSKTNIS